MSTNIKIIVEEVFKTNDKKEQIKNLEDILYKIIKKEEYDSWQTRQLY